ncbi:MAG: hypothetical protein ACE5J3_13245, partial [Methanosarcinales archaeon]
MYHAARAAVYVRMRLDVPEHKKLIKKFEKVLVNAGMVNTYSNLVNKWRSERNKYEYYPLKKPDESTCIRAIEDCKEIIETCKNLIVVI